MTIERTKDKIIVELSPDVDLKDIQDMLNYMRFKELTAGVKVPKKEVDRLARESKSKWWRRNKKRYLC